MKRVYTFLLVALFVVSCSDSDNSVLELDSQSESVRNVSAKSNEEMSVGQIHNLAMDNFRDNFTYSKTSDYCEQIADFNESFFIKSAKNLALNEDYLSEEEYCVFLDADYEISNYLEGDESLYAQIEDLKNKNLLSSKQSVVLYNILDLTKENAKGNISISTLENELNNIKNNLNIEVHNYEAGYALTTNILDIAIHSSEWWKNNLPPGNNQPNPPYTTYMAPWVMADVLGGLGTGFMNMFEQHAKNPNKPIDVGSMAYSMVKGAVISSVSPWGRLSKLIVK